MSNDIETIVQRLIDQDIFVNASTLISELARNEEGRYIDDLAPCLSAPDYSEAPDGYTVRDESGCGDWVFEVEGETMGPSIEHETEHAAIVAAWEDSGDEPDDIEALQHWVVSDYLADELEAIGALVARDVLGFEIWGRTECGQSLTMDSDLRKVAERIKARLDSM